jgi:hypothetical protein
MRKDKPEYKYMPYDDEIAVHNDGVTKETKYHIQDYNWGGRGSVYSATCTVRFAISLKQITL